MMLETLKRLLQGKEVKVTHTNNQIPTTNGVCKTVNAVLGFDNRFVMILNSGEHFMFISENVTSNSVDGPYVYARSGDSRRTITVIDNK